MTPSVKVQRQASFRRISRTLEDILDASFATCVARHLDDLRYCPTPDCGQMYGPRSHLEASDLTCSACLAAVCRACNISHDGMSCSCAEQWDATRGHEELAAAKKRPGIRDCPKCGVPSSLSDTDGPGHSSFGSPSEATMLSLSS